MKLRKIQTAYDQVRAKAGSASLDERIETAMYRYLREDLGLAESVARSRAESEVKQTMVRSVCDDCERAGLSFRDKRVLDLGAGLGGLSAELATRGARLTSLEPGSAWRSIAAERLASFGNAHVIGAVGEDLPFPDNSFDLIMSLQVLEHVHQPARVVAEAFRVLKPGGYIYISYENYLSFWEPHYRVRWLPLLPKVVGSYYLTMLGRNPQFLQESVTYTTFSSMRRAFFRAGFQCMRRTELSNSMHSSDKMSLKWRLLKGMALVHKSAALESIAGYDYLRRMFRTTIDEFMQKPY